MYINLLQYPQKGAYWRFGKLHNTKQKGTTKLTQAWWCWLSSLSNQTKPKTKNQTQKNKPNTKPKTKNKKEQTKTKNNNKNKNQKLNNKTKTQETTLKKQQQQQNAGLQLRGSLGLAADRGSQH